MNQKQLKKLSLLADVASYYYEHELSQSEIAEKLHLSRTRISRLLKQAKENGVVEIKINYTFERNYNLESRVKDRFNLKDVYLLNNRGKGPEEVKRAVGYLASNYLKNCLSKEMTLGVSWGTTIYETVNALTVDKKIPIDVVQMMGATAVDNPNISANELTRKLAEAYGGRAHYLNAPLFTEDEYVMNMLINDPVNSKVLEMVRNSDVILTGIGSLDQANTSNPWLGYMSTETFEELKRKNAVGCVGAHFYDKNGDEIECVWNKQCIGLGLKNLRKIHEVIAVASGVEKVNALLGAIKGNYLNVLISDQDTANKMMDLS